MRTRIAACTALVLGLAACGNPAPAPQEEKTSATDTTSTGTSAATTPAAATDTPDACALVTAAELAAIFPGRDFSKTPPAPRNTPGGPRRNAVSACTFVSTGASIPEMMTISIVLTTAYSDKAQASLDGMKSGLSTMGVKFRSGPIEGAGDAGYWFNVGNDRQSAVVVNVRRNPRHWLSVSESSFGQEEAVTVSRLTEVAKAALGRI